MARKAMVTKERLLEALKGSGGVVSSVAKKLNSSWGTTRKSIDKWEETKQAYEDESNTILDLAESTIFRSIRDGNSQDAKWLLSTKGKHRGYGEKVEIEHSGELKYSIIPAVIPDDDD